MKLGAFAGPGFEELRECVERAHHLQADRWEEVVWLEAVYCLCPDLRERLGIVGLIAPACGPIADLIDVEATKLEDIPPAEHIEWSPLTGYNELREALRISQNTLKKRLVEGAKPVEGYIRYKKAKPTSRKIQVAIADLPADVQARFRQ